MDKLQKVVERVKRLRPKTRDEKNMFFEPCFLLFLFLFFLVAVTVSTFNTCFDRLNMIDAINYPMDEYLM